ncbi:MAG: FGGY family carbohydrate kinase [Brevinema sp.]
MKKNIAMGVDSSTQSTTIVLRDMTDGTVLAQSKAKHPVTTPPCSEQYPEDWWKALKPLSELLPRVACISIGGQGHGLAILDENGHSIRKAKLWNDTESYKEAEYLQTVFPNVFWETRTGSLPAPALTISKLLWLERHERHNYSRIHSLLLPCDYMVFKLTGKRVIERGGGSGTGFLNPYSNQWEQGILDRIFPDLKKEILPSIVSSGSIVGSVQNTKELALLDGAVVIVGTGDNMTAAIGLNGKEGDTMLSVGTSGTVYSVTSNEIKDTCNGAINLYADATGRYLPMVTTLNAAKVTDFFRKTLSLSKEKFDRLVLEDKSYGGNVVLVPYLDGERTPNLPKASGSLMGLRTNTTKSHIASAVTIGIVCGLLEGRDLLEKVGVNFSGKFILTGGASQSAAYRQILSDLTEEEVFTCTFTETAAAGAALYAAAAVKNIDITTLMEEWAFPLQKIASPRNNVPSGIRENYKKYTEEYIKGNFYEK